MKYPSFLGAAVFSIGLVGAPAAFAEDWSGFNATLLGGLAGTSMDGWQSNGVNTSSAESSSRDPFVGVGLGYNHDAGDFVFGIDGDISLLTSDNSLAMKNTVEADSDWFATARARVGFDAGDTMPYLTGGVAFTGVDFKDGTEIHSETLVGWTAGGGFEHKVTESVSLKAEMLFTDFGNAKFGLSGFDTSIDTKSVLVRAGITLHF